MTVSELFATRLYRESLVAEDGWAGLNADLEAACLQIGEDDAAGQAWCEANGYDGYTSYASPDDLALRAPAFVTLKAHLATHATAFAKASHMDLKGAKLVMDSFWINILNPLAGHSGHIHPHSVISGTYYVRTPDGAGALRLEDPRLAMMMAAPAVSADAPEGFRRFVYVQPEPGLLLMWESWLRHEVTANTGDDFRISLSFNFSLE